MNEVIIDGKVVELDLSTQDGKFELHKIFLAMLYGNAETRISVTNGPRFSYRPTD